MGGDSSSDDEPLAVRFAGSAAVKTEGGAPAAVAVVKEEGGGTSSSFARRQAATSAPRSYADMSDDSDDVPLGQRVKVEKNGTPRSAGAGGASPAASRAEMLKKRAEMLKRKAAADKKKELANKKRKLEEHNAKKNGKKPAKRGSNGTQPAKRTKPESGGGGGGGGDIKWTTLEHGGVVFPPEYVPHGVKMKYNGQEVQLTAEEEEVATMFAVMAGTDYFDKPIFRANFWEDFRGVMKKSGSGNHKKLLKLENCDFSPITEYCLKKKEKEVEERKKLTAEDRKKAKAEKEEADKPYKTALVDGVAEQVGNFRVEPPGLFRGRGEHPKMGRLKQRVYPRDITINIGAEAKVPEVPAMYAGQRWKEVRHDNTVTWLAFWKDPINKAQFKYVWLAATSSFKTSSDVAKYEKARKLKNHVDAIREQYTSLAKSEDYRSKQMGTAMYFIDRLALRAGHEKDDSEEADTVGCCNLKADNVELLDDLHIKFDFLGKDSIRYENVVLVERHIYNNVKLFKKRFGDAKNKKAKQSSDQLFCELDAGHLNTFLKDQMDGLSVKVFRTFNASITLDRLLAAGEGKFQPGDLVDSKVAAYNLANREVAVLCNHQRAVPKTHEQSMTNLREKQTKLDIELAELVAKVAEAEEAVRTAKGKDKEKCKDALEKAVTRMENKEQAIQKLKIQATNKEDLKTVALGTSKINYLDPRITVSWCKRNEVPIEKVFNRALFTKFLWAMDVEPKFRF